MTDPAAATTPTVEEASRRAPSAPLRGAFTVSIDLEGAWGLCDRPLNAEVRAGLDRERTIVRRLLDLFERYDLPATWAFVGHLTAEACPWEGDRPHPELPRPVRRNGGSDWLAQHPPPGEEEHPYWYGRDVISEIAASAVGHELGSHSYFHLLFDEENANRESIEADLALAAESLRRLGVEPRSFIHPRNILGFREAVADAGFEVYRGLQETRISRIRPRTLKRVVRLLSHLVGTAAPTGVPTIDASGLMNVPESMQLLGRNGLRRFIRPSASIRAATAGLRAAADQRAVFHLWFHTMNFWWREDEQFETLERVFAAADELRRDGRLDFRTMGDYRLDPAWLAAAQARPAPSSRSELATGRPASAKTSP